MIAKLSANAENSCCSGMQLCHETLPNKEVHLVLDATTLCVSFDPPLHELRAEMFEDLSTFLNAPATFRGVGSDASYFKSIMNHNIAGL